jgi:S1-C subfamily serine protease
MFWMHLTQIVLAAAVAFYAHPQGAQVQFSNSDWVEGLRPSVVLIAVQIKPESAGKPLPSPFDRMFSSFGMLIIGSGFFVNNSGDVVTASHVASGVQAPGRPPEPGAQQIIQVLEASGIKAEVVIGRSAPHTGGLPNNNVAAENYTLTSASLVAVDPEHDIAVFRPILNPIIDRHFNPTFLTLALARPRDTDEIFACGYPFGALGMVTTSGAIASAWKSQVLLTSKTQSSVETYWVDLRINPGNSGGPVFRMRDHGVLGMAVEGAGSLGIVVPAKYIAEFLSEQKIEWHASPL